VYCALLEKYWQSFEKMGEIDKLAFHRRLFTMAKRQIIPYGEEFLRQAIQQPEKPPALEPLRLRYIRSLSHDDFDEDDLLSEC
jgi:hypothetical protein